MLDPSARCGGGWQRTWVLAATSGSAEDGRHGFGTPISIDRGRYPQKMGQGENPGKVKVTPVCLSVCLSRRDPGSPQGKRCLLSQEQEEKFALHSLLNRQLPVSSPHPGCWRLPIAFSAER